MKKILFLFIITSHFAFSQCDNGRYTTIVFQNYEVVSDIIYGNNLTYLGASQDLTMDIYRPVGDVETNRPLIMMAHGGSFLSGSKTGPDVVGFCASMAKMGYVVASINYRLGFSVTNMQTGATTAVMRGTQDMKAAIRYFRKDAAENGNQYGIDPNEIYAGGVSAGGFIALHLAYLDEVSELPSFLDMNAAGVQGGLEGESGNPGYPSDVKAIINICGAIGDTAWIHAGDEPACHFHGTNDNTVPYGSAMLSVLGIPVTEVDGSFSINEKMNQVGIEHCFEIHEGQDHVPSLTSAAYSDTTLSIMTQFLASQICGTTYNCQYQAIPTKVAEMNTEMASYYGYPNPAQSEFVIQGIKEKTNISIYNAMGSLIWSGMISPQQSINCADWQQGIYYISSSASGFKSFAVIKQ